MVLRTAAVTWMSRRRCALLALLLASVVAAQAEPCPVVCRCSLDRLSAVCPAIATEVPRGLEASLHSLDLSGHGLRAVNSATFAHLPQLQLLDMSRGFLAQVSDNAFRGLLQLRQLKLSGNMLTSLPEDAFPESLAELNLSGNPLSLPAEGPFLRASGLSRLDLSHCSVSSVADDSFSQLPVLVDLDLRGNYLASLPPSAFSGLHLQRLRVDAGSLGDNIVSTLLVVDIMFEEPSTVEAARPDRQDGRRNGFETYAPAPHDPQPDDAAYVGSAGDTTFQSDYHWFWKQKSKDYDQSLPLFGFGPRNAPDGGLFNGAQFQATGEATVTYASDLRNLECAEVILGALLILCLVLLIVGHKAAVRARGRESSQYICTAVLDRRDGGAIRNAPAGSRGSATKRDTADESPPPYQYPPSYEDSLQASFVGVRIESQPLVAIHRPVNNHNVT